MDLLAQTSFVFTNGNPYLDFPRPILHKTVMIGGFAVPQSENGTRNEILSSMHENVLFEYRLVHPRNQKICQKRFLRGLLDTFASMPDITFIWKYEEPNSKIAESLPNVYLSTWVPQVRLLNDKRLSLFLTHGGLASTNELAYAGKPAIVVPLLGDQMRNAQ
ncbi:unnamed protein product, partial [Strongylus vulgaris]